MALLASPVQAAPTDLSTWTAEGPGSWTLAGDNNSVTQNVNGNPAVFYSDFTTFNRRLSGSITVNTTGDDDFIGFVVGYDAGELGGPGEFLLIDWKQTDQAGFFGCTSRAGLAVSRVTAGLGDSRGAWCHDAEGVTELARGTTLGETGWADLTTYTFDIAYTPTSLIVSIDGIEQINLTGDFGDGRFGFYNYSQEATTYAGIQDAVLPPDPGGVPEPASWAMMIGGFGLVGGAIRRKTATGAALA